MENKLTITEKSAISKLPVNLQKYALARNSEIVSKMSTSSVTIIISKLIHSTMVNVGNTPKNGQDDVLITISENVLKLICEKYKSLTIDELKLACLNGSLGDYGVYYGINLKTVSDWIKGYMNDELKKRAMKELNEQIALLSTRVYSEDEKRKITISGIIKCFNEYSAKDKLLEKENFLFPINKMYAGFYDFLKSEKLINLSIDFKVQINEKCKVVYSNELKQKVDDRRNSFTQAEMDLILSQDLLKNLTFVNLVKKHLLFYFFDTLIQNNNLDFLNDNLLNQKPVGSQK